MGSVGIKSEKRSFIPYEVELNSGEISSDPDVVMNSWKNCFDNLLNKHVDQEVLNLDG